MPPKRKATTATSAAEEKAPSKRLKRSSAGQSGYDSKQTQTETQPETPVPSNEPTGEKTTAIPKRRGRLPKDDPGSTATPIETANTRSTRSRQAAHQAASRDRTSVQQGSPDDVAAAIDQGNAPPDLEPVDATTAKTQAKKLVKKQAKARNTKAAKVATEDDHVLDEASMSLAESAVQEESVIKVKHSSSEDEADGDRQYWLMKAEPNDRFEKGKNVKFSIDDLAAAIKPEPWDGVRNFQARNNMRLMRKGDLAFFYHSNCTTPGVVGVMRIVQEHSVDESAFDRSHPYYDEKSSRQKPKWEVVHVEFVEKFSQQVSLKTIQTNASTTRELVDMQLLKYKRLSVTAVTANEWKFILGMVDRQDDVGES